MHLVQAMDAGGGFLGHATHGGQTDGIPLRIGRQLGLDRGKQHALFFRARIGQHGQVRLGAGAKMEQQGCVAAVVQNHVGVAAVGPLEDAVGVIPVLFQRLALDGEDRNALIGHGGSSVILRGEDVAGRPADLGAQRHQRFDQHGGLDGHVQRAGDARAGQRLAGGIFLADGHQAGHLRFGDANFLVAPCGQ